MAAPAIELAICYARDDDEDDKNKLLQKLFQQLRTLERAGLIHIWNDREILAGTPYAQEIENRLDAAQIILLVVSASFIASDYCYEKELPRALNRHKDGSARVLTVILHPCDWQITDLKQFKPLPGNGQPISDTDYWPNQHNALLNVNAGVKRVALELQVLALLQKGEQQKSTSQYTEGLTIYEEALALVEQHQEEVLVSPKVLARLYQGQGNMLRGLLRAEEAELSSSDAQKALAAFEQALRHDDTLARSYEQKGILLYELGRYEEALIALNEAIWRGEPFPEPLAPAIFVPPSIFLTKYNVLLQLKRGDEALAFYEQNLTQARFDDQIHQQAMFLYEQEGQYNLALAACERAIASLPALALPLYEEKAHLLEYLERYEEALTVLVEYEQKNTLEEREEGLFYLKEGLLLEILGRNEEARAAFDKAIPLGPTFFGRQRIYERLATQASEMAIIQGYKGHFRPVHTRQGHSTAVYCLACSPGGHFFASGGEDDAGNGVIKLWDLFSGQELRTLSGHNKGAVRSVAFSHNGDILASESNDEAIRLWNLTDGDKASTWRKPTGAWSIAFSPDGHFLASNSVNGFIKIWNLFDKDLRAGPGYSGLPPSVHYVAFSLDGRSLASYGKDGTFKLWDLTSGKERCTLHEHAEGIRSAAFSPDGRFLAISNMNQTIMLWDLASATRPHVLPGHIGAIESMVFSPDGRFLVSGSDDGTLKIWNVASRETIQTLSHGSPVYSLTLSPDGYTLVSGGEDGTLKIWRLQ